MDLLMSGALAEGRGAQVTYQLGLSKHEQAVRAGVKLDLSQRAGLASVEEHRRESRRVYEQAALWWRKCLSDYPRRPGAAAARLLLAEALAGQGEAAEAAKLLTEGAAQTEDRLEKLGLLWRARQVK
jgi:hypothetical protein